MEGNITRELCEALCRLTHEEWNKISAIMCSRFESKGRPDPEFEAALKRHMSLTVNATPDELYERAMSML